MQWPSGCGVCQGGCLPRGEVSVWGCVCPGGCTPPHRGQTDTCEYITFPQLLLWTVIMQVKEFQSNWPYLECVYFNKCLIPTNAECGNHIELTDPELHRMHFRHSMTTTPTTDIYNVQKTLTQRSRCFLFLTNGLRGRTERDSTQLIGPKNRLQ